MSLNLTPVSTPHEKPLPPSRSKRASVGVGVGSFTTARSWSLRDATDAEVGQATRDELVAALRAEWEDRERLLAKLTSAEEQEERCMMEKGELTRALAASQGQVGSVYNEQSRLEADLEDRDGMLERARARIDMMERELKEAKARSINQDKAMEAERTAFSAQEANLNARIRQLQSTSSKTKSAAPVPSQELQADLDSLRASHATLLAQLDTLSSALQDAQSDNIRLKEENEGWEYLVTERTLHGQLNLFHATEGEGPDDEEGGRGSRRGQLEALDEELESEMDDLHGDLDAQSPILEERAPLSRTSTIGTGARRPTGAPSSMSRQPSISGSLDIAQHAPGSDLAAELGRADVEGLAQVPQVEELSKENKRLREEVKALQLYCSKIIDRIIAQDGFEHILSVDYKTRRMGRSASGRGSLQEVVQMMQGSTQAPPPPTATTMSGTTTPMPKANPVEAAAKGPTASPSVSDKSERRARRGFSLDLRSFGFGSSAPAAVETKTPLKPLTLTPGRKLDPQAEDDEDKRERHRLEAALKLAGIDKPPTPATEVLPPRPPARRAQSSSTTATPFARLSTALGFSTAPELPADPDPTPETVTAALKDYDDKERLRRESLSRGQAEAGYTSPPARFGSLRRTSTSASRPSLEHQPVGGPTARSRQRGSSISAMWAMQPDTETGPK